MTPIRFEVAVDGMTCSHCQRAVEQCIAELPGTHSVHVDLKNGRAIVVGEVNEQTLLHAIENEGYSARLANKSEAAE
ncbi:MAG: heavy metal-associated domain-containing protein [Planctomycetota bacterium]|jgi:copper chaperone